MKTRTVTSPSPAATGRDVLDAATFRRLLAEVEECRRIFDERTRDMKWLTAEDLQRRSR